LKKIVDLLVNLNVIEISDKFDAYRLQLLSGSTLPVVVIVVAGVFVLVQVIVNLIPISVNIVSFYVIRR